MKRLVTGGRVFTGDRILDGHAVLIDGGTIAAVMPAADAPADVRTRHVPPDSLLVPGFVDVQVNGAGGVLFNDTPTPDAALAIAAAARRTGATGILPTLMTDDPAKMQAACSAALAAIARPGGGVLGIHLEGPFLSTERPGVHLPRWMRRPAASDIELLLELARGRLGDPGRILMTLAPECVGDRDLARLAAAGILLAAGHTAATLERVREALAAGVRGFTHLCNAMPPIQGRQPGPVAAALADPDAWCCIIADGVHVHPALLQLIVQIKRPGKVVLVTDAMPPSGTDAVSFTLFDRKISRDHGRLVTEDGVLAGADIDMASSVRNCVQLLALPLEDSLRMASLYPAAYLRLDDQLGRAAPGYRADLALLAPDFSVLATWVAGDEQWYGS